MDSTLKERITRLYNKSRELDLLQQEISKLKEELISQLKTKGLTKTKFDFEDRYIRFNVSNDAGGITQKILKQVLVDYPEINPDEFMAQVLSQRTRKQTENIEIVKTKYVGRGAARGGSADLTGDGEK